MGFFFQWIERLFTLIAWCSGQGFVLRQFIHKVALATAQLHNCIHLLRNSLTHNLWSGMDQQSWLTETGNVLTRLSQIKAVSTVLYLLYRFTLF